VGVAKRLAMRLDRVASFNTVSEHTTLFEELHDKAAHLAGAAAVSPAQILNPKTSQPVLLHRVRAYHAVRGAARQGGAPRRCCCNMPTCCMCRR
jgi:hypothetical protein